jgi:hypothetical protein
VAGARGKNCGIAIFTIICAVIGAVLGIINTWYAFIQRRVRLRVVPKLASLMSHAGQFGPDMGGIEVINLSTFPVTVSEVGFTINGDPRKNPCAAIIQPIVQDGGPWPRRLDARVSVTVYFQLHLLRQHKIKKIYAMTDCGNVGFGESQASREWQLASN